MMTVNKSLEQLMAWRCGYASGLKAALAMVAESKDPTSRIEREVQAATAEARAAWKDLGEPQLRRD